MSLVCNKKKFIWMETDFPSHGTFMPTAKWFEYEIGIQFNNTPFVIDQNNFTTKIVSAYIVYDLDNWPNILLRSFTWKTCLFGATNTAKNSDKNGNIVTTYFHLMEKVSGILVMTLLGILRFLVLIIVHHLILMIAKIIF